LVIVAVNVTLVPAQMVVALAAIEMVGVRLGFTTITIVFDVAVFVVIQVALDVIVQVTVFPLVNVVDV